MKVNKIHTQLESNTTSNNVNIINGHIIYQPHMKENLVSKLNGDTFRDVMSFQPKCSLAIINVVPRHFKCVSLACPR